MTPDKTPSEAELLPCPFCGEAAKHSFNSLYGDMSMASCKSCGATAYAPKWNRRAVLAKWGQPAQAAEPVAWLDPWTGTKVTTDYDAYGKHGIPLYTAPQPVAREPLDEARRLFDAGWKAAALFCDREDVVADGIIGFGACPQFEAAFSAAQPVAREPLTDEQIKALMQAHRTAMLMTCKARVPECGEFAAIAQDLDWLCESFGIKGGQHGTE